MILTGEEIKQQVNSNRIHISPFDELMVNPNSYNYRLGRSLKRINANPIDPKCQVSSIDINFTEDGYTLEPGNLYLANTLEEIGSDFYVPSLIGRSSIGRLGMFLQITADLGNLGAKHCWTLEIKVVQPLIIYPKMQIGQVSFWMTYGNSAKLYSGKYDSHSGAKESEIYTEFSKNNKK